MAAILEVFLVFLRLGLTSFGGPVAHLGYFQAEFVARRGWLSAGAYADLVALCQFLPGPASSQVGMGLGLLRAGGWGMLAAWLGFTLPSALLMLAFALGLAQLPTLESGWLDGLKVAALAVVAQAVAGLWRSLIAGPTQTWLALGTAALLVAFPGLAALQVLALLICGGVGWRSLNGANGVDAAALTLPVSISRRAGLLSLSLCGALLLGLPLLAGLNPSLAVADVFTRAGALVFGGGHVVLPLLEAGSVPRWLPHEAFVAGYGAVQAVPGPLFSFAAFLGAAGQTELSPALGALVATLGIFLPAALLLLGAWPFWTNWLARPGARGAMRGLNAGVVGLLLAALYNPVFTSAALSGRHVALALIAYAALSVGKVPPWLVVLACAGLGWALL